MTCEPLLDDSFASQPDDFESSNEYQKLDNSSSASSVGVEMEKIINKSSMSESLLYCLDGNNMSLSSSSPSPHKSRKRQLEDGLETESSTESLLKRPLIETETTDL